MAKPDNPWASEHLIYRAAETPDDDELFYKLAADPIAFQNSDTAVMVPQSRAQVGDFSKHIREGALVGVVICLPSTDPSAKPTPIGVCHVSGAKARPQHRHGEIGIDILKEHQGRGYGSEAIRWLLEWAFDAYGLHRVNISAFEYNAGARRLYERLGFRHEGTLREQFYRQGRFWDDYKFGMLEHEWREMNAKTLAEKGK